MDNKITSMGKTESILKNFLEFDLCLVSSGVSVLIHLNENGRYESFG